jgi:two-component system, NtrC family, sensor kinase
VEAAPSGTEVVARVASAGDGGVAMTVSDRGAGVAPARAGELFEPFFTTKAGGTGLGLAVSRAIARAHGGDLRYARAGETTELTLVLPGAVGEELAS